MGLKDRIEKLEDRPEAQRCSECRLPPGDPGYIVISDRKESREQEWCPTCGQPKFFIIEVVYEDAEEALEPGATSWP